METPEETFKESYQLPQKLGIIVQCPNLKQPWTKQTPSPEPVCWAVLLPSTRYKAGCHTGLCALIWLQCWFAKP